MGWRNLRILGERAVPVQRPSQPMLQRRCLNLRMGYKNAVPEARANTPDGAQHSTDRRSASSLAFKSSHCRFGYPFESGGQGPDAPR